MPRILLFPLAFLWILAANAHALDARIDPLVTPQAAMLFDEEPEFLPVEQAYSVTPEIRDGQLLLHWRIADGYYLYREKMRLATGDDTGTRPVALELPRGEPYEDAFLGQTEVYRHTLELEIPLTGSETLLEVKSQGCADAGLCYPPRTQRFGLDPETGSVSAIAAPARPRRALPAGGQDGAAATPTEHHGLAWMALLAALGGMILNLMPCVFPVLSLKVLAIAAKGGDRSGKALHGIVYAAGVIASFVAIASLLLVLRAGGQAIGWGFHLQSPPFVAALVYLFVAMGLALSGLVNLGTGLMGRGDALTRRGGYAGTFFTGVLATVVASPCTAPFMGSALGWAMTRDVMTALTVFAALGAGMAAPFVLLTFSPALLARLPRPGAWMEAFRQLLAFPLYAAAVWLLWVLGNQSGVNAMALVAGGCVLLALALWSLGHARLTGRRTLWPRALAVLSALVALALLATPVLEARSPTRTAAAQHDGWEPYSSERLAELRARGDAVFVNVTADWCITCLANERIALSTTAVRDAFSRRGIVYLKGDWTNSDPVITRLLQAHGRSGVPLYLYFPPGSGSTARILPQLLTPSIVIAALDQTLVAAE